MKIYNNDYKNIKLKDKVDLIIIDIPYNLGKKAYASSLDWWKSKDYSFCKSEKANTSFFETDFDFNIDECLEYCNNNLKADKKVILFCSYEQQFEIINKMKKYNFKKYTPLVFIKNSSAEVLKANMRILGACEYGLVLYKGKLGDFYNEGKMVKNWFEFKRVNKKQHPTQKPVELIEYFIKLYTKENEVVLDFVMGSGTTGIACKKLNRNFIGIEIDKNYYEIAKQRLEGEE